MKKIITFCFALCATVAAWAEFTPAAFTVAEGKQVYFSQGNLQCSLSATDTAWSFATNQYDMLDEANVSGSTLANKIDLFGWSANNTTAPWGISTSTNSTDYSGDFVDWGKNIGNGNTWRTLTNAEWRYILKKRTNAVNLQGVACIKLSETEYVNGLILLPDSWTGVKGVTFKSGFSSTSSAQAYAEYQTFTPAEWQKLEAAGAVLLPASGYRNGASMGNVQNFGYSWSATPSNSAYAYYLYFNSTGANTSSNFNRYGGQAVRLVQNLYAVNIATATNGTVEAGKTAAAVGETIILTATPETGYEVEKITVTYGENQTVEVTANTFIMPASAVTVTATFKSTTPTALQNAETIKIYAENGRIYGAEGMQIFTVTGQNVTEMNGQLSGVYIVKLGNAAQKIVVR